ncbi:MAG: amino acid permease [Planctomycetota bacterium]|jgi:amino acid transporter
MKRKQLTLLDVFCIASGAMISSGIFILPGLAFSYAGPAVFISYFLAGVLALVGVLSVIELSTAMPKAGGDYYHELVCLVVKNSVCGFWYR